ncbi:MAG: hypothetical protein Q7U91_13280 [Sideroxyarcus sp.]|nr:hypothetical protein [Sideroxyarcus sp.]
MKSRLSRAVILYIWLLIGSLPTGAHGEGWSLREADWGSLTLGIVSGIVAHEAGHLVVAKSKGYTVSHDGLSITYPGTDFTRAGQLQLASAGFQTQWVLSELVLRDKNGRENTKPPTDFGAGVVISYVGVSAAYLTFLKNQYNGDIYGMSRATGMSHDRLALMMAIPAMLDAWRLFGNDVPTWVPAVSVMSKGVGAAWIWTY